MKVNVRTHKLLSEREKRAWSQQHLSDASGLSLRTIQRVESTGRASSGTILSLAATLGLDVQELIKNQPERSITRSNSTICLWAFSLIGMLGSLLYVSIATAEDGLKLDYSYQRVMGDDSDKAHVEFLLLFGESAASDVKGHSKIVFHGRENRGFVELEATLYEYTNENETEFVGSNTATSEFGQTIVFTWLKPGDVEYRLEVIPSKAALDL